MEAIYRWESAISFCWQDSCTKDSWSFFRKMARKAPTKRYQWNSDFERANFLFFLSPAEKSAFTALRMVRTITAFDPSSLITGHSISPQTCI